MKKSTKLLSFILALVMIFALAVPSNAAWDTSSNDENKGKITINSYEVSNTDSGSVSEKLNMSGRKFVVYRILNATVDANNSERVAYSIPSGLQEIYKAYNWKNAGTPSSAAYISTVRDSLVSDATASSQAVYNNGMPAVEDNEVQAVENSDVQAAENNEAQAVENSDVQAAENSNVQTVENNGISDIDIMKAIADMDSNVSFVGTAEEKPPIALMAADIDPGTLKDDPIKFQEAVLEYIEENRGDDDELQRFAKYMLGKLTTVGSDGIEGVFRAEANGNENGVVFNNLPFGYYLVAEITTSPKVLSTALLTTVHTEDGVEIHSKDVAPTVKKYIDESKKTGDLLVAGSEVNSAEIGETVNYRIVASLPDVQGYTAYRFIVKDTLGAGLDPLNDDNDITINYYENNSSSPTPVSDNDILKKEWNGKVLTVWFKSEWTLRNGYKGIKNDDVHDITHENSISDDTSIPFVVIQYSAKVNSNAIIGGDGNPNEAQVFFSNNPTMETVGDAGNDPSNPNGDEPGGETPKSTVKTYVFQLNLEKIGYSEDTDAVNHHKKLAGAKFVLKKGTGSVQYAKFEKSGNNMYVLSGWDGSESDEGSIITSLDDGAVSIKGLEAGTYTLDETKAPEGYKEIDDIVFTISYSENDTKTALASTTFTKSSPNTGLVNFTNDTAGTGIGSVVIENTILGLLPGTGGVGRVIIYVVGAALALGAVALFIMKRRAAKEAK